MKRLATHVALALALLALAGTAHAQFNTSGTTSVTLSVAAEAAIRIDTATTTLTTSGGIFGNDFTGSTAFTYKIRTTKVGGTGAIQLRVTSDFNAGGPSVASPPSPGDALTYTCTVSNPGSGCSSAQTASTASFTSVGTFGADAKSAKDGNSGSVAWNLTNDPVYSTGSYAATVTFTISAT